MSPRIPFGISVVHLPKWNHKNNKGRTYHRYTEKDRTMKHPSHITTLGIGLALVLFWGEMTLAWTPPPEPSEAYLVNEDVNIITGLYTREILSPKTGLWITKLPGKSSYPNTMSIGILLWKPRNFLCSTGMTRTTAGNGTCMSTAKWKTAPVISSHTMCRLKTWWRMKTPSRRKPGTMQSRRLHSNKSPENRPKTVRYMEPCSETLFSPTKRTKRLQ